MKILKYFTNNQFVESKTDKYYDVFNPSTGEQIAKCPRITTEEVRQVIENAQKGYEVWSSMPVTRRVQVLYKVKQLLEENLEELTILLATEHGKAYREA